MDVEADSSIVEVGLGGRGGMAGLGDELALLGAEDSELIGIGVEDKLLRLWRGLCEGLEGIDAL